MFSLMPVIKSLHISLATVSVSLFIIRFIIMQFAVKEQVLKKTWAKVAPHIIDTFLLVTGITLAIIYRLSPFHTHWLQIKLLLIAAYIVFGYLALKTSNAHHGIIFAAIALLLVTSVTLLAITKPL